MQFGLFQGFESWFIELTQYQMCTRHWSIDRDGVNERRVLYKAVL